MICMKSSTGVTIRFTLRLVPAQMPSGSPMTRASSTEASTSAKVSMASFHSPCITITSRPTRVSTATRMLPSAYATKVSSTVVPNQPISGISSPTSVCANRLVKKVPMLSTPIWM